MKRIIRKSSSSTLGPSPLRARVGARALLPMLILAAGLALLTCTVLLRAQTAVSTARDNLGQFPIVPPELVPQYGTFWSLQRTNYPPLPFNPFPELPVSYLYGNSYMVWDLEVDYPALIAQRRLELALRRMERLYGIEPESKSLDSGETALLWDALEAEEQYAGPAMMSAYSYSPGSFYLEITKVDSNAWLTLHGTSSEQLYAILSAGDLTNSTWQLEKVLPGAAGQDWTETTVPVGDRTNRLFFRGQIWPTNDVWTGGVSVSLTQPTNGAYYEQAPTNLTLQASASSTNGTVLGVAFYHGSTLLGWDAAPPYSLTWNGVGRGRYSLRARAFDSAGGSRTSDPVQVSVDPCYDALDVMLVIDRSSSMDISNRLDYAKLACSNFVGTLVLPPDQAGIVTFDSNVVLNAALTTDGNTLLSALASIDPGAGTYLSNALHVARTNLVVSPNTNALRAMIVLTDGEAGDKAEALVEGELAKTNDHVRIFTVAIGTEADKSFLSSLASSTNDYFYSTNGSDLSELFSRIAVKLCRSNAAPQVSITAPGNGSSFQEGELITLQATATDADSGVAQVVFYRNNALLGWAAAGASNSYSYAWSSAPVGTNTITAVAWDWTGLSRTSSPVVLTVIHPAPTVQWVEPTNGQVLVFSPTNVLLHATASAASGAITNVEFRVGTNSLGSDTTEPFSLVWTNVSAASNYTLTVIATDSYWARGTNTITNLVNAMPQVWLLYPTNTGSTNLLTFREGTNLTLQAVASDSDGSVTNVQFWRGNELIAGVVTTNAVTNFSLTLSNVAAGGYPVTAVARDDRGAVRVSELVVFEVRPSNAAPWVTLTFPATNGTQFNAGADITITAQAGDEDGSVTNVEFFIDGALFGNDTQTPYSITKCCWSSGTHVVVARATDNSGNQGVSMPITVTVGALQPRSGDGYWDPTFGNPGAYSPVGHAFEVHDQTVYLGTLGGLIGGVPVRIVAKWDGTNWTDMSGTNYLAVVLDLAAYDTNLYLAGIVESGERPNIGRWDGADWVQVGTNTLRDSFNHRAAVHSITVVGSDLYVGGEFVTADGDTNVQYVARLNPTNDLWEPVGNGLNGPVYSLATIGNRLFAGGAFTNAGGNSNANLVAELAGGVWTNLDTGLGMLNSWGNTASVRTMAVCDGELFVGGDFMSAAGNTNANGIARWDGWQWSCIGKGLSGNDGNAPMTVRAIVPQGKTILYVGGDFTGVWQGTNDLVARNIAKALWSEAEQAWTWADLDEGLSHSWGDDSVSGLALMPGATPECFDLLVAGRFTHAGSLDTYSSGIARWRVGYPTPPGPPSVSITNPANYAVFTNEGITLSVEGHASSSTNLATIECYLNGSLNQSIGVWPATNNYDFSFQVELTNGLHRLEVVATDDNTLQGQSLPRIIAIKAPNNSIVAADDFHTAPEGSLAFLLPVTSNDTASNGIKRSHPGSPGSKATLGTGDGRARRLLPHLFALPAHLRHRPVHLQRDRRHQLGFGLGDGPRPVPSRGGNRPPRRTATVRPLKQRDGYRGQPEPATGRVRSPIPSFSPTT